MNPRPPTLPTLLGLGLIASCLAGCDDLSDFSGSFEGSIVEGGFVRDCFGPKVVASLRFDPDLTVLPLPDDVPASQLNALTTSDGVFDETPLVLMAALPHDQLSKLDFPGSRRLRSYLLFARPDAGPLAGRDATVVVSLMDDDKVELRVMARSDVTDDDCSSDPASQDAGVAPSAGPHVNEYFGLWLLGGS